jgi:hypothetical protein
MWQGFDNTRVIDGFQFSPETLKKDLIAQIAHLFVERGTNQLENLSHTVVCLAHDAVSLNVSSYWTRMLAALAPASNAAKPISPCTRRTAAFYTQKQGTEPRKCPTICEMNDSQETRLLVQLRPDSCHSLI